MGEKKKADPPVKKYRAGGIVASVWENKGKDKNGNETKFNTVSMDRSYKDQDNEWQKTSSLRKNDLPKAVLVLNKAFEFLSLANDESKEEEAE